MMATVTPNVELALGPGYKIIRFNDEFNQQILPSKMSKGKCFLELFDETDIPLVKDTFQKRGITLTAKTLTFTETKGSFPIRVNYDWTVAGHSKDGALTIFGKRSSPFEPSEDYEELVDFFNKAPIALHWLDSEGRVLWANDRELEVLGYTREEYIGENIMKFCPDSEDVVLEIFKQLGSGNTIRDVPVRFRSKGGSIRDLLIDSNVNFKHDGSFNHTRCFIRDDTRRKITEAHDIVEKEMTLKLNTEKSNFVSKLIHEIKTPLHIISMVTGSKSPDIDTLYSQTNKITRLIENVLHAMRFEDGKIIRVNKKQTNIHQDLDKHVAFLRKIHETSNIILRNEFPNIYIIGDSGNIMHVISELVENASTRSKDINIHVFQDEDTERIVFKVCDSGYSINQEDVHRVFQNYWTSDFKKEEYSFDNPGLGIGLNIAFNIVQCMGSELKVESSESMTSFEFKLDTDEVSMSDSDSSWGSIDHSHLADVHILEDNESERSSRRSSIEISSIRNILLVEDNTICQKICKRLLTNNGNRCDIASNGKIAVDMVHENPGIYDIIFMDIRMPVLDGIQASIQILEINSNIPIIALSAEESPETRARALDSGISKFVNKPATEKSLLACIADFT